MRPSMLIASVCVLVSFTLSGYALYDRFQQGNHTRLAICQSENVIRKVLHDEHEQKLRRTQAYLKTHPRGTRDIPLSLILQSIADERAIVASVKPKTCT